MGDHILLPAVNGASSAGGLIDITPHNVAVVLDFFATWCPPCEPQMDHLRAIRDQYSDSDLFVVSITQESDDETIESFWSANNGTWPVVKDPGLRATREYDATSIPTIVVLAADGTEVARETGLVRENRLTTVVDDALERE